MDGRNSNRTAIKLFLVTVMMFGFGYALVPLYNVMCDIAGINGKTGTITREQAERLTIDNKRTVTVEFDTNVNGDLPWEFKAPVNKMRVHPGKVSEAVFVAENKSDKPITGQAIPSVAPHQASIYFNKTECFCFTQQTLAPYERKEMPVRFVVDAELPEKISTLTLSYTFFQTPGENITMQQAAGLKAASDEKTRNLKLTLY